jgi:hypothetical protein
VLLLQSIPPETTRISKEGREEKEAAERRKWKLN